MKLPRSTPVLPALLIACAIAVAPAALAQEGAAQQSPQQRVETLKKWLASSQQALQKYEWVQTVTVTVDGKPTKNEQYHCYYGVDGKLQKVQIGSDGASEKGMQIMPPPARLLAKIKEHKAEEVKEFAERAQQLVQTYVPPDPEKIQAAVSAGKMSLNPAGAQVRLSFADYMQAGDTLGVTIEAPTDRLISIAVDTYVDQPEDAVQFNAQMGVLPDGTIYASHITLAAPSKKLNIVIDNTGHRPASS